MPSNPTALAALFLLFMIYSFIGWCGEMIYCSIGQRRLCEKRGFLNGTICPIYGHGALLVLWALHGGCENPLLTFFFGMLLTTAVEYVTSYAMEKLFHMRWWDYSKHKFQINGRVCLLNSTLFGLACVLLCHVAHPRVMRLVYFLVDHHVAIPLAAVLLVLYLADIVVSVRSAIQMSSRLEKLRALQEELQSKLEELKREQQAKMDIWKAQKAEAAGELRERLSANLEERRAQTGQRLREGREALEELGGAYRERWDAFKSETEQRMKALLQGQDRFERRLMRSYPSLRSERYAEAIEKLRQALEESAARRKRSRKKK